MTERALLIKFASHGDYAAIGVEAPSAVRVFRVSDASLAYTASAIPTTELASSSSNNNNSSDATGLSLLSHSSVNETLTSLAMTSPPSAQQIANTINNNNNNNNGSDLQNKSELDFTCNLIMGTSNGRVSLFDCIAGRLRWSSFIPDGGNVAVKAVAHYGDFVFASTARNTLSVFSASSGRLVFSAGNNISSSSSSSNGGANKMSIVELGNAKSLAVCEMMSTSNNNKNNNNNNNANNALILFVGGLQPVAYRMSSVQQQQQLQQRASTSLVLEPYSQCSVHQAACDHVSVSASSSSSASSAIIGTTSCYSEGIVRVWNLRQQQPALCIQVCDIAASPLMSSHHHQRLSHVSVDHISGRIAASTVSGSMFLWKSYGSSSPSSSPAPAVEALTATAPCATLLSPSTTQDLVSGQRNEEDVNINNNSSSSATRVSPAQQKNGRIVAAFFFQRFAQFQQLQSADSSSTNNRTNFIVVVRRNWSAPIFQPWRWAELTGDVIAAAAAGVSAKEQQKQGSASMASSLLDAQAPRVLPAVTFSSASSRGEDAAAGQGGGGGNDYANNDDDDQGTAADGSFIQHDTIQQRRRAIHLPQSTGKLSASSALKGLDLPSAGAFAFPKVQLRHASDMSQLPSSKSLLVADGEERAAADDNDDDDDAQMSMSGGKKQQRQQQQQQQQQQFVDSGAGVVVGGATPTAGVAPALYQALHADDASLVMEILGVGGRTQPDRDSTVQSLSLRYVVQLVHLLSQRLLTEGAKSSLHVWIATVMKLRGRELFAVIARSKNNKNNNNSKPPADEEIDADSLRGALLPLLEHYRAMLAAVGSKVAFSAGRSSIFKSVRRRDDIGGSSSGGGGKKYQQSAGVGLIGGARFVETEQGVVQVGDGRRKKKGQTTTTSSSPSALFSSKAADEEQRAADQEMEAMLVGETYNKMRRRKQKEKKQLKMMRAKKKREKRMLRATQGGLVDESGLGEDGEGDEDDEELQRQKFRHAPDGEGDDYDEDIGDEDDDDEMGDDEDEEDFDPNNADYSALIGDRLSDIDEEGEDDDNSDLEDDIDMDDDEAALLQEIDAEAADAEEAEEEEDDNDGGDGADDDRVDSDFDSSEDLEEKFQDDDDHEKTLLKKSSDSAGAGRGGPSRNKQVDFD